MSQPPPPFTPGQPMQPHMPAPVPQTNGWAIASLICGILGCVPLLTSFLAAVFGIAGIKKSGRLQGNGKGMAVVGLVLGILGILGWAAIGGTMGYGWYVFQRDVVTPARTAGNTFMTNLASGDLTAAKQHLAGSFSDEKLAALSAEVRTLGSFKSFGVDKFDANQTTEAGLVITVEGTATFDTGSKKFRASLVNSGNTLKIQDFNFSP